MLALSFCRVAFIPLFLLCNVQPRHYLPLVFDSDVAPMVIMVAFAFTNGYFGTLCMMYGPRLVICTIACLRATTWLFPFMNVRLKISLTAFQGHALN